MAKGRCQERIPTRLCHYTSLSKLVSILESGTLRLNDPAEWEDKNDAASVLAYLRKTGAEQVRAVSFADGDEQIHHWFEYAHKEYGAGIRFKTPALLAALKKEKRFVCGPMCYTPLNELSAKELKTYAPEELPFIKRRPYESEQEYRVLWTGGLAETPPAIPVAGLIDCVTLAPGMTKPLPSGVENPFGPALAEMLSARYAERYGFKVQQSRLLNSPDWRSLFNKLK
jgi:hypothetical protein